MANSKNVLKPDDSPYYKNGKLICSPEPKYPIIATEGVQDNSLERMRAMIRGEFSQVAHNNHMETFEEANDFDVEDAWEYEPPETKYMQEEYLPSNLGGFKQRDRESDGHSEDDPAAQNIDEVKSPKDETFDRGSESVSQ